MKTEQQEYCERLSSIEHDGVRYYQCPSFPRYWMNKQGEIIFNKKNRWCVESDKFSSMSYRRQVSEIRQGVVITKAWWVVYGEVFVANPDGLPAVRRVIRSFPVSPDQFEWTGKREATPHLTGASAIARMVMMLC